MGYDDYRDDMSRYAILRLVDSPLSSEENVNLIVAVDEEDKLAGDWGIGVLELLAPLAKRCMYGNIELV
jgi:hypothetical protein